MSSRMTTRSLVWLVTLFGSAWLLLASDCLAQSSVKTSAAVAEESWQVIHIGGQRVGYQYSRERVELRDKKKIVITVNDSRTTLKRFGQELKMSSSLRIEEAESGELLRFSFEVKNPPIQDSLTEGIVNGEQLELTTTLAGRTDKRRVPWEPDTKSPAFPDRWLRDHPLKPGETKSFKVYLPEIAKLRQSFNRSGLTHVGDCKMAALATRADIAAHSDFYLCPLSAKQMPVEELYRLLEPVWSKQQPLSDVRLEQINGPTGVSETAEEIDEDSEPIAVGFEYTVELSGDQSIRMEP